MFLLSLLIWFILLSIAVRHPIKGKPYSLCGGCFGGDDEQSSTSQQTINYTPEATEAQSTWSNWLKSALSSGDYGATDMNWNDIFSSAENKINQYYWGGVGTTGLAGKVKASAARRNASQSPAVENQLSLLGMQQSGDLSDLITNLTTQKASYTESARKNWLSSLSNLAGLSSGSTTETTTTGADDDSSFSSILGSLISGGLGLATGGLSKLFSGTSQSSLSDKLGSSDLLSLDTSELSGFNWTGAE
jgi:hypothetical protein